MWNSLVDKGIGGVLTPWQMRREGSAAYELKAEEMIAFAHAEQSIKRIQLGRASLVWMEPILLSGPTAASNEPHLVPKGLNEYDHELVILANQRADVIRKEINVAKAVLEAETVLVQEAGAPPNAVPEIDWLYKWRDLAAETSSESMQKLWGSVLAGEFKKPGSHSLRTLDFLRCLSQTEATLIAKAASFVIAQALWSGVEGKFSPERGLTLVDATILQDLGLISSVGRGMSRRFEAAKGQPLNHLIISWNKALLVSGAIRQGQFSVANVSSLGMQIFALTNPKTNEDNLVDLGKFLKHSNLDVALVDFEDYGGRQYRWFNDVQL